MKHFIHSILAASVFAAAACPLVCAAAPQPEVHSYFLYDSDDETGDVYGSGRIETVYLTDDSFAEYPELGRALAETELPREESLRRQFREMTQESRERTASGESFPYEASLETGIQVTRADEQVFSFRESFEDYAGGAHGYYCSFGYNFNVADGSEILLSDIVADEEGLREILTMKLLEMYPDSSYGTMGRTLDDYSVFADPDSVDAAPYPYKWVLEPDGILFWFDPYEIASYAEGTLSAFIGFDEAGSTLRGSVGAQEGAMVRSIPVGEPQLLDINGDGEQDYIYLESSAAGTDFSEEVSLTIHLSRGTGEMESDYFYDPRAYLMRTAGGKCWLYVDVTREDDYHTVEVFDLNGDIPVYVGNFDGGFAVTYDSDLEASVRRVPVDPECLIMGVRINLLSTYQGIRSYRVGEDGMPEPLEKDYAVQSPWAPLHTIDEVPVNEVDPETGEASPEVTDVPAGEDLYLWRTDGESYVDMKREDGSIVRILVTMDGWPAYIDGREAEEYFETLYYAG